MVQFILLSIALVALFNLLVLSILEIITYYHDNYHVNYHEGAHPGRIRGALVPAGVRLGGMSYNVKWIILEGRYLDEKEEI